MMHDPIPRPPDHVPTSLSAGAQQNSIPSVALPVSAAGSPAISAPGDVLHPFPTLPSSVCGLETEVLQQYLETVKHLYPLVDKATRFLEIRVGQTGIAIGVTNQRDALGHLVTLLTEDQTLEEKKAQVHHTDEHLRRAVVESYKKGFSLRLTQFRPVFEAYRAKVLPRRGTAAFVLAPTLGQINAEMQEIQRLATDGRDANKFGIASLTWEQRVDNLIEAFDRLHALDERLAEFVSKAEGERLNRSAWLLTALGVVLSVIGVALTIWSLMR